MSPPSPRKTREIEVSLVTLLKVYSRKPIAIVLTNEFIYGINMLLKIVET